MAPWVGVSDFFHEYLAPSSYVMWFFVFMCCISSCMTPAAQLRHSINLCESAKFQHSQQWFRSEYPHHSQHVLTHDMQALSSQELIDRIQSFTVFHFVLNFLHSGVDSLGVKQEHLVIYTAFEDDHNGIGIFFIGDSNSEDTVIILGAESPEFLVYWQHLVRAAGIIG